MNNTLLVDKFLTNELEKGIYDSFSVYLQEQCEFIIESADIKSFNEIVETIIDLETDYYLIDLYGQYFRKTEKKFNIDIPDNLFCNTNSVPPFEFTLKNIDDYYFIELHYNFELERFVIFDLLRLFDDFGYRLQNNSNCIIYINGKSLEDII